MSQKKSFTDNPALQFISTVHENETETEQGMTERQAEETQQESNVDYKEQDQQIADQDQKLGAQTNETAEQIKEQPKEVQPEIPNTPTAAAQVPMKLNPLYIETKSKRVQLLMQPSLYNKLKEKAIKEKTSVNDLVHSILAAEMER